MTETAKLVIDRLQFEAGCASSGEVDKLVYSGLDVHVMLKEVAQAVKDDELENNRLREETASMWNKTLVDHRAEYIKLEKKLATAVEALKRITEIPEQEEYFDCEECISMMEEAAEQALAEIGGEDE